MKKLIKTIVLTLLVLNVSFAWSQDDKTRLDNLMRSDSADINALASYPDSARHTIFLVATESNGLEKLAAIQKNTNNDFKNLISAYSKDDQQKIWNLTRYDNLVSDLVNGGQKSSAQIEAILKNYPQDVHDDALNFGVNHYDLLVSINNVNQNFSDSYNDIVKDYPAETQTAFSQLLNLPDVITIMTGNIDMTAELGNIYRTRPDLVNQRFGSLNAELARQKAQDTQAWKDSLKNNPEAMNELQASAEDYAKTTGSNPNDPPPSPEMVAGYHPQPYPYWAGYPTWYGPDYWYPNPYWYDAGFYSYGGNIVFIGVPNYHFAYWGFHHYPHYFYSYPHLSNLYYNRYYGPHAAVIYNADSRYSARMVNQWTIKNRSSLPNDFFVNDGNRADRFRELGQAEMDRRQYNKANPAAKISRQEYMNQHVASYPHIQSAANNEMRMNQNGSARHVQGGQQRMNSGPTPVYQSPGRGNTNTNYGNGRQTQNGRRQGNVQQRQMNNQPRQQMQRQQPQQRNESAPRREQGGDREEGGRK